jgi:ribosome recycling factor
LPNVAILDARTISIQPWEKNMLQAIEKAILQANIGITPQNDWKPDTTFSSSFNAGTP